MISDSPQWIAAKAEGDRAEYAVAEWFKGRGFEPYKTLGLAGFDLLLQAQVEVKHDLKAPETGNVAVETAHNGDPSGILTSRATYWAIVVGNEAIIMKTDELRAFVLRSRFPEVAAGDRKSSTIRLIPVERLRKLKGARSVQLASGNE